MVTLTTNIGTTLLPSGRGKAVRWSQATTDLDNVETEQYSVVFADANQTLNQTMQRAGKFIKLTGLNAAARNLVVPNIKKDFWVLNYVRGGFAITVKTAEHAGFAMDWGDVARFYTDGTTSASTGIKRTCLVSTVYDLMAYVPGTFVANQVLYSRPIVRKILIGQNMAGSRASVTVAPTADRTFSIRKNGTQFCTFTIANGQTEASFATTAETTLTTTDTLTVLAPSTADGSMANLSLSIAAQVL